MLNAINWPQTWLPGTTDNFVSNEVIVQDLSFETVVKNLIDSSQWEKYYYNSKDVEVANQDSAILKLNSEFKFKTFGFDVYAKVSELEIDETKKIARVAWMAWTKGEGKDHLEAYHAWLIEVLPQNRLRILTQETQKGEPAKALAHDDKFPMLNGHQAWLVGLVNYSKN